MQRREFMKASGGALWALTAVDSFAEAMVKMMTEKE